MKKKFFHRNTTPRKYSVKCHREKTGLHKHSAHKTDLYQNKTEALQDWEDIYSRDYSAYYPYNSYFEGEGHYHLNHALFHSLKAPFSDVKGPFEKLGDFIPDVTEHYDSNRIGVEKRMYNFLERACSLTPDNIHDLSTYIRPFIRSEKNIEIIDKESNENVGLSDFYNTILFFAPFWIREPSEWNPATSSLTQHLFEKFKISGIFEDICKSSQVNYSELSIHWMSRYIILAQGGSISKASKFFGWSELSNKFYYYLRTTPYNKRNIHEDLESDYIEKMIAGAFLYSLGATENVISRITENANLYLFAKIAYHETDHVIDKLYSKEHWDDLNLFRKKTYLSWKELIYWLIRHADSLTDQNISEINNWAIHQIYERQRHQLGRLSFKGRSVQRILQLTQEYYTNIHNFGNSIPKLEWKRKGFDCEIKDDTGDIWSVQEIVSSKELVEEGKAMSHCVASYYQNCFKENIAIFSFKKDEKRELTLELNCQNLSINQVTGKNNRSLKPQENRIVNFWFRHIVKDEVLD